MLGDRKVFLVMLGRFVARLGGEAAFFIGVWGMAAYRFDATPAQLALLMAVLAIASMVGSAGAGGLVDRFGPRNVLIGAQIVYVPIVLAVTLVTSVEQLIGMCALFGVSTAPIMTATGSFAPYLASETTGISKVNALLEGAGALSFVLGPGAGAVVARVFGIEGVFYLDAILTTMGVLLVLPVHTPPLSREKVGHPVSEAIEGFKISYGIRSVRYYVLMGTLVWFSFGAFGALEPLFYRDVVKTGVETIGYMNSIFGLGIGTGAFVLTRLPAKFTSARSLAAGAALCGLGAMVYVGTVNLWVIAFGAFAWGSVIGAVEPLLRTLMQLDAPEEFVGRVMGTAHLHRSAGEIVPLAVAPALAAAFGVQAVMIGGGVVAAGVAMATFGIATAIDVGGHRQHGVVSIGQALPTDEPRSPLT